MLNKTQMAGNINPWSQNMSRTDTHDDPMMKTSPNLIQVFKHDNNQENIS